MATRSVQWFETDASTKNHLSETLVVRDMASSLLFVPALTKKNISVISMRDKVLIVDLDDSFSVLGTALRDDNGLY